MAKISDDDQLVAPPPAGQSDLSDRPTPAELVPISTPPVTGDPVDGRVPDQEPQPGNTSIAQVPWAALQADVMAGVEAGAERLLRAFEEKLAFDRFKEEQIAKLHSELQSYRSDLVGRTARPFIQALIRIHDEIGKSLDALRKADPVTLDPARFFKLLESFQDEVVILLDQNGVEAFREAGATFNPRTQRALRTVRTPDQAAAGRILEQRLPGFRQGEQILEKERVVVAVHTPQAAASTSLAAQPSVGPKQESEKR